MKPILALKFPNSAFFLVEQSPFWEWKIKILKINKIKGSDDIFMDLISKKN